MAESTPTILWPGKSGTNYRYWIYPIGHQLAAKGGNYIFAYMKTASSWQAVYYGQTGDLSTRFDNHHKAACILENGATHVLAHLTETEQARLVEEEDLLNRGRPVCNDP